MVAEVGLEAVDNRLFRVTYDGTLYDERHFCAIGGQDEQLSSLLGERFADDAPLTDTIRWAKEAFDAVEDRDIPPDGWEAAVVDRTLGRRTFRRLTAEEMVAA